MWIDYNEYMMSPEWADKRELVKDRCGEKCEGCGRKKMRHVHHLTYERFGDEALEDLQGLCLDCHQKKHPHRKIKKEWLLKSKIAEKLNVTIKSLNRILIENGYLEREQRVQCYKTNVGKKKKYINIPTNKAYSEQICKKKPKVKSKGTKGPYVWDFPSIQHIVNQTTFTPHVVRKTIYSRKSTKSEMYNKDFEAYGLACRYNKQKSHYELLKNGNKIGSFHIMKYDIGYISIGNDSKSIMIHSEKKQDIGFPLILKLLEDFGFTPENTRVRRATESS